MVGVSSEGSWVRRDLEHVYVSMKKKRVCMDYIDVLKTYAEQDSKINSRNVSPFWDIRLCERGSLGFAVLVHYLKVPFDKLINPISEVALLPCPPFLVQCNTIYEPTIYGYIHHFPFLTVSFVLGLGVEVHIRHQDLRRHRLWIQELHAIWASFSFSTFGISKKFKHLHHSPPQGCFA